MECFRHVSTKTHALGPKGGALALPRFPTPVTCYRLIGTTTRNSVSAGIVHANSSFHNPNRLLLTATLQLPKYTKGLPTCFKLSQAGDVFPTCQHSDTRLRSQRRCPRRTSMLPHTGGLLPTHQHHDNHLAKGLHMRCYALSQSSYLLPAFSSFHRPQDSLVNTTTYTFVAKGSVHVLQSISQSFPMSYLGPVRHMPLLPKGLPIRIQAVS